jgi:hypothetical protein
METLHTRAEGATVQEGAPLHARHGVLVHAPIEAVWTRVTDVAHWPDWHPAVRASIAPAALASGATFVWVNYGSRVESTVALAEAPHLFAWSDSVSTAKAIHVWRLSDAGAGDTRVEVEESMDGFLVAVFYGQVELDRAVTEWLADLKRSVEVAATNVGARNTLAH